MANNRRDIRAYFGRRLGHSGLGPYSFLGCSLGLSLMGLIALVANEPMVFPSLGPTLMLFFEQASQPAASPRNTLLGHGIGILCGWASLVCLGLYGTPSVLVTGITVRYILAASLSLGLTAFCKHLVRAPHPPAGATTLIISLGLLTTPKQLASIAVAVLLVTVIGWCINRLMGVKMPVWRA